MALVAACLLTRAQTADPVPPQDTNATVTNEAEIPAQADTNAVFQAETNAISQGETNAVADAAPIASKSDVTNSSVELDTNAIALATTNAPTQREARSGARPEASAPSERRSNMNAQADGNVPTRPDYSLFKIVAERNIFNPNRTARSARSTTRPRARETKVETFALVGTMTYDQVRLAFFDGTSRDYKKALKPTEAIAGYTIKEVAPDHVKLESKGKLTDLKVGMQMRRQDQGDWRVNATIEPIASDAAASSTASSSTGTETSGAESEILKKLMQKREQELKK